MFDLRRNCVCLFSGITILLISTAGSAASAQTFFNEKNLAFYCTANPSDPKVKFVDAHALEGLLDGFAKPQDKDRLKQWDKLRRDRVFQAAKEVDAIERRGNTHKLFRVIPVLRNSNIPSRFHLAEVRAKNVVAVQCRFPEAAAKDENAPASNFVIRKNIKELIILASDPSDERADERTDSLESAQYATVSYTKDYENDTKNFSFEGVMGYRINRWFPFLGYKSENLNGDDKDLEVVTPGIIYDGLKFDHGKSVTHIKAQGFGVLDRENHAERLNFSLEAELPIGTDNFWFGQYNTPFAGDSDYGGSPQTYTDPWPTEFAEKSFLAKLWIRPQLNLLTEASHVTDPGTNSDFKEADNYWGLGGSFNLKIRTPHLATLKNLLLTLDYRYLRRFAIDENENIRQLQTTLEWAPDDAKNYGFSVSYTNGENALTFQDEDVFKVSLGIRY